MKKIIIIFIITFLLLLMILFGKNKYLGIYNKKITIFYDFEKIDGYVWEYKIDNPEILKLKDVDLNKPSWTFTPQKDGKVNLIFEYKNESDMKYKIIYGFQIKNKKIYWFKGEGLGMLYYPDPK